MLHYAACTAPQRRAARGDPLAPALLGSMRMVSSSGAFVVAGAAAPPRRRLWHYALQANRDYALSENAMGLCTTRWRDIVKLGRCPLAGLPRQPKKDDGARVSLTLAQARVRVRVEV